MVFKREVTTVDRVELDLRHVRWRPHAGAREKRVVDAGGDHHLTLVCFEKLPCIGDRLPVVPDIVESMPGRASRALSIVQLSGSISEGSRVPATY
ncbi:MAG: hypothetical protein WB052_16380 [Pseudolabrys sp.]